MQNVSVPAAFPANEPHGTMRASDADRDRVAEALREAYAEGRLDVEEHNERIDLAYKAKTLGELSPLLSDLPQRHTDDRRRPGHRAPCDARGLRAYGKTQITAVFAEQKRGGRWIVPSQTIAAAVFGSVTIDLREAVLTQREVVIVANAVFGSIEIKVPHGVVVRDEGTAVFGSRSGCGPQRGRRRADHAGLAGRGAARDGVVRRGLGALSEAEEARQVPGALGATVVEASEGVSANSAIPSAKSTPGRQPRSARIRSLDAVMCRTSPRR